MIYAMSDIHGCYGPFLSALEKVNLEDEGNTLVLLGDYIDRGANSQAVLRKIIDLQQAHPGQVIALRGNHEDYFLEWADGTFDPNKAQLWPLSDEHFSTTKSFLGNDFMDAFARLPPFDLMQQAYEAVFNAMRERHPDIIDWVRGLPYYHETDRQILVHAGVDEGAGECWHLTSTPETYTTQPPLYKGRTFIKDVIAGHLSARVASGTRSHKGIYHDGASHYFIDGTTIRTRTVLVLAYDEATGTYSGPGL